MTRKIKDLVVKVGTYTKNGKEKGRYVNVGSVFQKDDGGEFMVLNRTFNPAGVPNPENRDSVIINAFDVNDVESQEPAKAGNPVSEDEVPF